MYWPILKWRHRETVALRRLSSEDADSVCPLFELPLGGWDYDTGRPLTVDSSRFRGFGTSLAETWGQRVCAIDSSQLVLEGEALLSVVIDSIFHQARRAGCKVKPVISLCDSESHRRALARVLHTDAAGIVIRLRKSEMSLDWPEQLSSLIYLLGVRPHDCDLIVDFESHANVSVDEDDFATELRDVVTKLPDASSWASLVIAGTSIPAAMPFDQYWPHGSLARSEVDNFWRGAAQLAANDLVLHFGDYAVQHPNGEMVDPRLVGRALTLVYATQREWLIFPAPGPDAFGIRHIAREWKNVIDEIHHERASGGHCWADEQLEWIRDSPVELEELRSWPQIATNRHLSVTARQMQKCCIGDAVARLR